MLPVIERSEVFSIDSKTQAVKNESGYGCHVQENVGAVAQLGQLAVTYLAIQAATKEHQPLPKPWWVIDRAPGLFGVFNVQQPCSVHSSNCGLVPVCKCQQQSFVPAQLPAPLARTLLRSSGTDTPITLLNVPYSCCTHAPAATCAGSCMT